MSITFLINQDQLIYPTILEYTKNINMKKLKTFLPDLVEIRVI